MMPGNTETVVDFGGYVREVPPPAAGEFEVALVLAGAVSAGAYTAGVLDFLIEALDSWEAAKAQRAEAQPDPRQWDIPGHRVRLKVVSGASAGSMTAAVAAVALRHRFPHAQGGSAPRANPFYRTWVESIDISSLLETRDLQGPEAAVTSLLDSTVLRSILDDVLDYRGDPPPPRPYLRPGARFIFTHGNLRGIPYFLSLRGATSEGLAMVAHSDYQSFCVDYSGSVEELRRADDTLVETPNSSRDPSWSALGRAALASGAFPIGLAPTVIERRRTDFDYRFVTAPGTHGGTDVVRLRPRLGDGSYRSVVVDGGTMNNEPLALAHRELAGLIGQNPRRGEDAYRASVLVDPFPDPAAAVGDARRGQRRDLVGAALALVGAWRDQARFNAADLALADDEDTYSRFLIAPSRGAGPESQRYALACGAVGGFSGFLAKAFRHHDYHLGRRNCQQFLRHHFALPVTNLPVFGEVNPRLKEDPRWLAPGGGPPSLSIIPLLGGTEREEPLLPWPSDAYRADVLDPLDARLRLVLEHLTKSWKLDLRARVMAKLLLPWLREKAVHHVKGVVAQELGERGLARSR